MAMFVPNDPLAPLPVLLPKVGEQLRIVEIADAHDARIHAEEACREKLVQLKRGLMEDLLAGRVRVKPFQSTDAACRD
jgi:type I restriction enzyme S subunit